MDKKLFFAPLILTSTSGGAGSVIGQGTGQGTNIPGDFLTYQEWWEDIAWEGTNPDADYNGDGSVNEDDYNYYIENKLYEG